jgi:hypothetical protein
MKTRFFPIASGNNVIVALCIAVSGVAFSQTKPLTASDSADATAVRAVWIKLVRAVSSGDIETMRSVYLLETEEDRNLFITLEKASTLHDRYRKAMLDYQAAVRQRFGDGAVTPSPVTTAPAAAAGEVARRLEEAAKVVVERDHASVEIQMTPNLKGKTQEFVRRGEDWKAVLDAPSIRLAAASVDRVYGMENVMAEAYRATTVEIVGGMYRSPQEASDAAVQRYTRLQLAAEAATRPAPAVKSVVWDLKTSHTPRDVDWPVTATGGVWSWESADDQTIRDITWSLPGMKAMRVRAKSTSVSNFERGLPISSINVTCAHPLTAADVKKMLTAWGFDDAGTKKEVGAWEPKFDRMEIVLFERPFDGGVLVASPMNAVRQTGEKDSWILSLQARWNP